ncbi:MAG: hypothetical protein WBB67_00275 [bacterium]
MSNNSRKMRKEILTRLNRLQFNFQIHRKGHFFEVVINEKYKNYITAIKILLTVISLISAFFVFQSAFFAFIFGLAIYVILFIVDKVLFSYSSMFIHSMPDFTIESEKWTGCGFGYATSPSLQGQIPVVSWIISDIDYARKIHSLLLAWSYGELNDQTQNICMSVILLSNNRYVFFCYPNFSRKGATEFFEKVEKGEQKAKKKQVHNKINILLVLGKEFLITTNSYFPTFQKRCTEGTPFLFSVMLSNDSGKPARVDDLQDFYLYNLKIRKRQDLTKKDLEFDHMRILGNN